VGLGYTLSRVLKINIVKINPSNLDNILNLQVIHQKFNLIFFNSFQNKKYFILTFTLKKHIKINNTVVLIRHNQSETQALNQAKTSLT
jgi:hypothetical protein